MSAKDSKAGKLIPSTLKGEKVRASESERERFPSLLHSEGAVTTGVGGAFIGRAQGQEQEEVGCVCKPAPGSFVRDKPV